MKNLALISALVFLAARAGPPPPPDAHDIMERSNLAFYYAGRDMRAKMVLELKSGEETKGLRVMTMLRLSAPDGDQKYLLYFHAPGDVRRMSCMTWKHVGRSDERWMFVPATGRVVQVRAPERSSFLGSELVREEFSGRDVDSDTHRFLRLEPMAGRPCYVIESVPRKREDFTRYVSWIDRETYLPLRLEFHGQRDQITRVFTAGRIVSIPSRAHPERSYPTALERSLVHPDGGRWTRVVLDSVQYDIGLRDGDFTEAHLRVPLASEKNRALAVQESAR
jgi:outer membrane lipoprotein-sorting protein